MKIVCAALAAVIAVWSGRAHADCSELDKDDAAWASKLVVRGAMVIVDCDSCSGAAPTRVKKVEVRKGTDPATRLVYIDGKAVDLSMVFVQTGIETFTSVGALIGCSNASDAMVRRVSHGLSGVSTGIPACDRYVAAMDKFTQCPAVPQATKDATRQGIDQIKQSWQMLRDPSVPPEAKQAANDACLQAVDALKQAGAAMGCPM
jgi:hypothetical protein